MQDKIGGRAAAPVHPGAHQIVHDIVPLCHLVKHVLDLGCLLLHWNLCKTEVCTRARVASLGRGTQPPLLRLSRLNPAGIRRMFENTGSSWQRASRSHVVLRYVPRDWSKSIQQAGAAARSKEPSWLMQQLFDRANACPPVRVPAPARVNRNQQNMILGPSSRTRGADDELPLRSPMLLIDRVTPPSAQFWLQ